MSMYILEQFLIKHNILMLCCSFDIMLGETSWDKQGKRVDLKMMKVAERC